MSYLASTRPCVHGVAPTSRLSQDRVLKTMVSTACQNVNGQHDISYVMFTRQHKKMVCVNCVLSAHKTLENKS